MYRNLTQKKNSVRVTKVFVYPKTLFAFLNPDLKIVIRLQLNVRGNIKIHSDTFSDEDNSSVFKKNAFMFRVVVQ